MPLRLVLGFLLLLMPLRAAADRSVFFFGNSLIHHLTETDETSVPHWLALLARAGGHDFAAEGTWGFLADFAGTLPPEPKWGFAEVARRWEGGPVPFAEAGFDTVVLNPPNFIQSAPPQRDVWGGPALDLTAEVFRWAAGQGVDSLFIYEGWADMGSITAFPPSRRGWARYHAFNLGENHRWYRDYVAALAEALPGQEIGLIPAASVISHLVTAGPLTDLGPEDLYSDDSPHGTATTYLLAAMVSYAALWGETPPAIPLSSAVHPALAARYDDVAAAIHALVPAPGQGRRMAQSAPAATGLADPALGLGLAGIADWATGQPFLDLMKTARPWVGHLPGQWGGFPFERLRDEGWLDPQGWPRAIPPGVEKLETFILTEQPAASAPSLAGRYVLRHRGRGEIALGGLASNIAAAAGEIRFDYAPGPGLVVIAILATDPSDPIRDISVVREDRLDLVAAGALFNPDWLRIVADARVVRFMDWMQTNGSPLVGWEERPRPGDFSYAWRGVPVEVMVALANEIGADPWFTLPHRADDAFVAAFAAFVRDHLDPRLHVHAEWSNEVWNAIFPQAAWAREQARLRWGEAAGPDAWMQFAGIRAAEVADIWAAAFAEAPGRLVRVIATHTGWPGLEEPLLTAPLGVAEGRAEPWRSFDAYAVTGYFGQEVGEEGFAPTLRAWIAAGTAASQVEAMVRAGSLRTLTEELFPYHARVAAAHGLRLVMYEGGTHIVGQGAVTGDDAITAFLTGFNYTPGMAALYAELLAGWDRAGGTLFNAFVDVDAPGRWGSWGALRHLDDDNPRWATLAARNAAGAGWEVRAPGTFLQGILRRGTAGDDTLAGTPEEDILLGGNGDDTILAGPGDRVHGGAGRDRAILAGLPADWHLSAGADGAITALSAEGALRLVEVEEIVFSDGTAAPQAPADPG